MEVLCLIKCIKSGLRSFVLDEAPQLGRPVEVERSNQDINREQSILYHMGDSQHTQNIQINQVIGENEKMCLLFYGKK